MSLRHVYALHEVYKPEPGGEPMFDTIAVMPVGGLRMIELADQLDRWARETVQTCGGGEGLYLAEFSTADADGRPDRCLYEITLWWDGAAITVRELTYT